MKGSGWFVVVPGGFGTVVAEAVVVGAGQAAVVLGGGTASGPGLDVVDLEVAVLVAGGVVAGAVADLDGAAGGADVEAGVGAEVDDPGRPGEHGPFDVG